MLGSTIRLQVQPTNGDTYSVAITLKTAIAFEREFKTTLAGAFSDNPSIEHICWLAWHGTRESGRVVKLFDEWVTHDIEDITLLEEEADPLASTSAPIQSLG
jgi:hypothetical protein|tara:strand:+ start:227 stop:532 length:306 start_codon:yes stop_codon:yes gene_type:complete